MRNSEKIFVAVALLVSGSLASMAVAEKAGVKETLVLDSIQKMKPPVTLPHAKP